MATAKVDVRIVDPADRWGRGTLYPAGAELPKDHGVDADLLVKKPAKKKTTKKK